MDFRAVEAKERSIMALAPVKPVLRTDVVHVWCSEAFLCEPLWREAYGLFETGVFPRPFDEEVPLQIGSAVDPVGHDFVREALDFDGASLLTPEIVFHQVVGGLRN